MTEEKVMPFSNGSQFGYWESINCDECKKSYKNQDPKPKGGEGPCELDNAIGIAYVTDGKILASIAKRLGFRDGDVAKHCPEKEEISECVK